MVHYQKLSPTVKTELMSVLTGQSDPSLQSSPFPLLDDDYFSPVTFSPNLPLENWNFWGVVSKPGSTFSS